MKYFTDTIKGLMDEKKDYSAEPSSPKRQPVGQDYVGSFCRVLNDKNICYFIGQIEEFSSVHDELKIVPLRSGTIPQQLPYNAPVKLHVQHQNQVIILYGFMRRQTPRFWWIQPDTIIEREDQREGFRQALHGTGMVMRKRGEEAEKVPCELIDISLGGVCIRCRKALHVSESIVISEASLYPDSTNLYTFECIVCRSFTKRDSDMSDSEPQPPKETYYGCAFESLSSAESDRLYRDIFFLQKQDRRNSYRDSDPD